MNSYLRRKRVPTRDTNLGPPSRRWRFIPALAVGVTLLVGVPASFAGSISGYKFLDQTNTGNNVKANGVRDDQDTLLENHMIVLKQDGHKLTEQLTDDDGHYSFQNLSDGTYQLLINIPKNACSTAPKADNNSDHSRNVEYEITIKNGQDREIDIGIADCKHVKIIITPKKACANPSIRSQGDGEWNDSTIWLPSRIPSGGDRVKLMMDILLQCHLKWLT